MKKDRRILFRCYRFLSPYRRLVIASAAMMVAMQAITLATPQIIRLIVDRGIRGADVELLTSAVVLLLGLVAVKGVLTFLQGRARRTAGELHVDCSRSPTEYN